MDICRLDHAIPTSETSLSAQQTPVTLSINSRNRRPCTSLAFCRLNPNLLANGLDKFRTEYGLVIWDLEQSAPAFEASAIDDHFDRLTDPLPNPVSFSGRMPRSALNPHPRSASSSSTIAARNAQELQRLGSRGKTYQKPMQDTSNPSGQWCQAEGINSCVFQSNSSWEVVAGVNNRLIRYFDLRVRSKAVNEAQTKAVRGICCDPMDGNLIASLDDIGVHVWDRRRHTQPIMMFQEEDAGIDLDALITNAIPHAPTVGRITGVEFCNTRRNVIGTTTRDGSYVRLWNLVNGDTTAGQDMLQDDYSESTDFQPQNDWEGRGTWNDSHMTPSEDRRQGSNEDRSPILAGTSRSMNLFTSSFVLLKILQRRSSINQSHRLTSFQKALLQLLLLMLSRSVGQETLNSPSFVTLRNMLGALVGNLRRPLVVDTKHIEPIVELTMNHMLSHGTLISTAVTIHLKTVLYLSHEKKTVTPSTR